MILGYDSSKLFIIICWVILLVFVELKLIKVNCDDDKYFYILCNFLLLVLTGIIFSYLFK